MAMKRSKGSQQPASPMARRTRVSRAPGTLAGSLEASLRGLAPAAGVILILSLMPVTPSTGRHRTALVTGAGRRLGREIALVLAQRGWNLAIHYRASAQEARQTVLACEQASGRAGSAHAFAADLADEAATRALLPAAAAHFGHVDAVVHN